VISLLEIVLLYRKIVPLDQNVKLLNVTPMEIVYTRLLCATTESHVLMTIVIHQADVSLRPSLALHLPLVKLEHAILQIPNAFMQRKIVPDQIFAWSTHVIQPLDASKHPKIVQTLTPALSISV
jgi:uncharacterized membrane protein YjdF